MTLIKINQVLVSGKLGTYELFVNGRLVLLRNFDGQKGAQENALEKLIEDFRKMKL